MTGLSSSSFVSLCARASVRLMDNQDEWKDESHKITQCIVSDSDGVSVFITCYVLSCTCASARIDTRKKSAAPCLLNF